MDDIKQKILDHLNNPRVIVQEATMIMNESDGVKSSFNIVTIDLDAEKDRSHERFIANVKEALRY